MHSKNNTPRGFTLIELIVVVAIIGILASVILANLSLAREKARIARAKADLYSLNNAAQLLLNDTDKWINGCPAGIESDEETPLNSNTAGIMTRPLAGLGTNCSFTVAEVSKWNGPYAVSVIDPWGNPYFFDPDYCHADNVYVPVIESSGPNGVQNYGPRCYTEGVLNGVDNSDDVVFDLPR